MPILRQELPLPIGLIFIIKLHGYFQDSHRPYFGNRLNLDKTIFPGCRFEDIVNKKQCVCRAGTSCVDTDNRHRGIMQSSAGMPEVGSELVEGPITEPGIVIFTVVYYPFWSPLKNLSNFVDRALKVVNVLAQK